MVPLDFLFEGLGLTGRKAVKKNPNGLVNCEGLFAQLCTAVVQMGTGLWFSAENSWLERKWKLSFWLEKGGGGSLRENRRARQSPCLGALLGKRLSLLNPTFRIHVVESGSPWKLHIGHRLNQPTKKLQEPHLVSVARPVLAPHPLFWVHCCLGAANARSWPRALWPAQVPGRLTPRPHRRLCLFFDRDTGKAPGNYSACDCSWNSSGRLAVQAPAPTLQGGRCNQAVLIERYFGTRPMEKICMFLKGYFTCTSMCVCVLY